MLKGLKDSRKTSEHNRQGQKPIKEKIRVYNMTRLIDSVPHGLGNVNHLTTEQLSTEAQP